MCSRRGRYCMIPLKLPMTYLQLIQEFLFKLIMPKCINNTKCFRLNFWGILKNCVKLHTAQFKKLPRRKRLDCVSSMESWRRFSICALFANISYRVLRMEDVQKETTPNNLIWCTRTKEEKYATSLRRKRGVKKEHVWDSVNHVYTGQRPLFMAGIYSRYHSPTTPANEVFSYSILTR